MLQRLRRKRDEGPADSAERHADWTRNIRAGKELLSISKYDRIANAMSESQKCVD